MTPEDMATVIRSLEVQIGSLDERVHVVEDKVDTLWTPPWKRLLFAIDGWPLYRLSERRQRRPWHRGA